MQHYALHATNQPRKRSSSLAFNAKLLVQAGHIPGNIDKDGLYKAFWPIDTLPELVIAYDAMVIIRFGDDLFHLCTGP